MYTRVMLIEIVYILNAQMSGVREKIHPYRSMHKMIKRNTSCSFNTSVDMLNINGARYNISKGTRQNRFEIYKKYMNY